MSERMTDEELEKRFRYAEVVSGGAHVLREEMLRARASEVQKDAVIKALADALVDAREWVQNPRTRAIIEDALRLAGRL